MIQEIPEKVCKKCSGSLWRSEIYKKGIKPDGTLFTCLRCVSCKKKNALKSRQHLQNTVPGYIEKLRLQEKIYHSKPEVKLRHNKTVAAWRKANRERYLINRRREYKNRDIEQYRLYKLKSTRKRTETISNSYIRQQVASLLKISVKEVGTILTQKNYEEYRQSLFIHRKLYPLKSKNPHNGLTEC